MASTPFYPGRQTSETGAWNRWGRGLLFAGVLVLAPAPVRRWMLTMFALMFGIIFTIEHAASYFDIDPTLTGAAFNAEYDTVMAQQAEFFGLGYQFPWYCTAMIIAFCVWGPVGYIRAIILSRRYRAQRVANGETLSQRVRAFTNSRVLIAVDGTPRPPQGHTGPSPVPTAPPPSPAPAPS